MGLFSFFNRDKKNILMALQNGALIIDVRTPHEYDTTGKLPNSVNIPLDRIASQVERFTDMNRPIVCCCASGIRSKKAVKMLKSKGKKDIYNGGSWRDVFLQMKKMS